MSTPYLIDIAPLLTEDERLTWATTREFASERIQPLIADHYERGAFPRQLIPEFARMGLLGAPLSGYGCAGLNPVAYGLTMLELERVDSGIRSFCSVQTALAMWPIYTYGSEAQKDEWLPRMARGEAIGCFGLTEPDAGSDPGSMRTYARRAGAGDDADWILHGSKMWITNGSISDVAVVWAKTDDGVTGFLVERGMKGFTATDVHHKISLRASITSELSFDEARLPAWPRLPKAKGLRAPLRCLTEPQFGIISGVVGAARDALASALNYANSREQF